jgi:hypothetical protein
VPRPAGGSKATTPELIPLGKEQQVQKWQFGGHWPPEASVGQLSSQFPSPQSSANPLTLNVSMVRITMRITRRTAAGIPYVAADFSRSR